MHRREDALCRQVGSIIGGKSTFEDGICTVTKPRNLQVTILGRPTKSAANLSFAFESFDANGTALCLAELMLLQDEIQPVCNVLAKCNIPISALHNHWIYTNPTILYLHFQAVDYPLNFATKVREITKFLR